jgi:hypothetical protein
MLLKSHLDQKSKKRKFDTFSASSQIRYEKHQTTINYLIKS